MTITINSRHISIIEIKMAMSGIRKFLDANFLHGGQVAGRARNPGLGLLSSVYTHMEHSDSNLLQTSRLGTPRRNDYDAMFRSSITELVNFISPSLLYPYVCWFRPTLCKQIVRNMVDGDTVHEILPWYETMWGVGSVLEVQD